MKTDKKIKMINIRMDFDLIDKFQKHCNENGYSISKRIRVLIKTDLNNQQNEK